MLTRRGAHFHARSKVWRWALLIAGLSLGALAGAALANGGDAPHRVIARGATTTTASTSTTALEGAPSSTVASQAATATKSGGSAGSTPAVTRAPSIGASAPATTAKPAKATPTTKPSPTTSWWYDYCKPYCSPDGTRPENPRH